MKSCILPVMSAPSSTSPMASESWKLSSWYKVLPVLVSLKHEKAYFTGKNLSRIIGLIGGGYACNKTYALV